MNANPFATRFEDLPASLPIFPLPGVLLLPRGRLPLNLFEPRYLAMGIDALAECRMIGMIQPLDAESDPVSDGAGLYTTGCAGRITSFSETEDGRLLITLMGVCRFDVVRELPSDRGYRRVEPNFAPYRADIEGRSGEVSVDREELIKLVREYLGIKGIELDWDAVEQAGNEMLITSLAMVCPFEGQEKQALLEAPNLDDLSKVVVTLMDMAVKSAGPGAVRH